VAVARRRKELARSEGVVEERAIRSEEWAPASPTRPPTHSIRFDNGPDRLLVVSYCATWAAKKAVDTVIGEEEFKWINNRVIEVENGVRIKSDQLEEIMEYEMPARYEEWDFPPHETNKLRQIAMSSTDIEKAREERRPKNPATGEPLPPRIKKERGATREMRKGLVTVQQICEELGIDPREARGFFRKRKLEKPAVGWAFDEGRANEIRKMLEKEFGQ
jgi:hypothetical protein